MQQPSVVAVIDDLFFQAKVRTALQHLGLAAESSPTAGACMPACRRATRRPW